MNSLLLRLRRGLARTPLRIQLVAALLALVTAALLATGLAGTAALRGYLVDRVDGQLQGVARSNLQRIDRSMAPLPGQQPPERFDSPREDFYLQLTTMDGRAVGQLRGGQAPPSLPRLDEQEVRSRAGQPFTVPAQSGEQTWRALVLPLADRSGSVTVALSLADVQATVGRLTAINLVVGVVVLTVLAGLGYAVVRSSLRPLEQVEDTAEAIAAGDLSQRVPDRDPRTEVGRLSRALNGMLAQIEAAFRARAASEASARASEDRMRRFVADASHELRTPLTSIRGFAELYRQGAVPGPADAARIMRRVEDEARRMGMLVDDLLLLARLDEQRPLERRPVDLLTLAADAVHDGRAIAPDRSIDLRVHADPPAGTGTDSTAPIVLGDEARLRQVVGNLISNAIAHTPPGTPVTVTVGAVAFDAGDRGHGPDTRLWALLEVRDAGPGLRREDAARVFERFYRADPSRARSVSAGGGGSGLGLAIVAALVAAHGGTVDLDTSPGQGAAFRVLLPLTTPGGAPALDAPAGQPVSTEQAAALPTDAATA
jgi:two-component system, OmpR family, sensor kinase